MFYTKGAIIKAGTTIPFLKVELPRVDDALTRKPLVGQSQQCQKCFVCYGERSMMLLVRFNGGRCRECGVRDFHASPNKFQGTLPNSSHRACQRLIESHVQSDKI